MSVNDAIIVFLGQFAWDTNYHNYSLHIMISILYDILYLGIELNLPLKKSLTETFLGGLMQI